MIKRKLFAGRAATYYTITPRRARIFAVAALLIYSAYIRQQLYIGYMGEADILMIGCGAVAVVLIYVGIDKLAILCAIAALSAAILGS